MNKKARKSNIVLIGFMGTGKTTVGKILAQKLNKEFIEMDEIIEQKAQMSIPDIFAKFGEIRFREYEISVAKELSEKRNCVISTGGGFPLNKINVDYFRGSSYIVLLQSIAKDILDHISIDGKEQRPLLNVEDPIKEIRKLLAFRKPFYEAASDLKIITYKKFPEQIADEIINLIKYLEEGDVKYLKNPSDLNNVFNDISNVLFKEGIPLGGKNGDKNKEGAEGTGQGANPQSDKENKVLASADKKKSLKVNKHVIDISKTDAQNKLFSENFPITKIMKLCSLNKSIRPLDLVNEAFRDEDLIKDPYHLYALIPAAILYALRNKIKKDGPLIIRKELLKNEKEDKEGSISDTNIREKPVQLTEIRDENIAIAIMRAFKIQYGAGVYMGIAEPAIATGISFSVMLGATQKYARFVEFSNRATLFALQTLIEHHLFGEKNTIKSVEIILKRIPDFFKDFFENY